MKNKILITGSRGFIGKNITIKINESDSYSCLFVNREDDIRDFKKSLKYIKCIIHLAAENRSDNENDFQKNNVDFTQELCNFLTESSIKIPIIFTSSVQTNLDNIYGITKKKAELVLTEFNNKTNNPIKILNLTNVFGKWAKESHNSFIATFCKNIGNNKSVIIDNETNVVHLSYIDNVVKLILKYVQTGFDGFTKEDVKSDFSVTVGEIYNRIKYYHRYRTYPRRSSIESNLDKYLYSTFLSYLDSSKYAYSIDKHTDDRGDFIELFKDTIDCQISFFTSNKGVTRGKHYHHTKVEKFFVLSGKARFKYINVINKAVYEETISSKDKKIIETIPGWSHEIKNVGDSELKVIVWANELFNHDHPDTYAYTESK